MDNWSSTLTTIGMSVFSEAFQQILGEMDSKGLPANNSVITEAATEAVIKAVAAMITQNNTALLAEMSVCW